MDNQLWKTADGAVMKIVDMTDSHLQNSINMLKRKLDERPLDVGPDPDDSDGAYWGKLCEERHNERVANSIEKAIEMLEKEKERRWMIFTGN